MKILKWLSVVVLLLAVVLVVGGLLISPKFTVTRSATIAAPADKVYPLIADAKSWSRWAIWHQRDPAMQIEYGGPPSGPGAKSSWKSDSQGSGTMTFTAAEPHRRVAYELYFPEFGTTSAGEFSLVPEGSGTRVTWVMNGNMGSNPVFRWLALAMDDMVGKDFEAGLANLKAVAEKS